jgi:hypothetical protein
MAFHEEFEMSVNANMQVDGQPGRAYGIEGGGADVKKNFPGQTVEEDYKDKKDPYLQPAEDDFDHKKDRPPRFSTLMGVAPKPASSPPPPPPLPPPPPPPVFFHEYYPPPREHRRGVYVSMPLFIVFVLILFFESTLLFGYTLIGLYGNAPTGMFSWSKTNTTTTECACGYTVPSINIAPNFIIPGAAQAKDVILTTTPTSSTSAASATLTPTSTLTTTVPVSGILSMIANLGALASTTSTSSQAIVTITPTRSTITSVKMLTADASGNIIDPSMKTLTSTTVVDPPKPTSTAGISSRDEGAWALISGGIEQAQNSVSATVTA